MLTPVPRSFVAMLIAVLFIAACEDKPFAVGVQVAGTDWGPLTVARGLGTGDKALTAGVLVIEATCVFLTRDGEWTLVIWPSAQSTWEEANHTITFRNRDGSVYRLTGGQQISLSGGGFSRVEDGRPPDNFLEGIDWANPPRPECITPEIWSVGEVV
jgi:hypothetical protein